MKKIALYITVFIIGFLVAILICGRQRPATVEVAQRGPSAAGTIIAVLAIIIGLVVILTAVGAGVILAARVRRQHLQMEQAALLFGAKQEKPRAPRPRRPQIPEGGNVIIVSGGGDGSRWEV